MEYPLNQAVQSTLAVLAEVRPGDLGAPTPCASWDVRALVNHFVGTARWWAATIAGDSGVPAADYAAGNFVAAYEESIQIAVAAFEADGALARTVRLPFGEFSGTVLLGLAATEQFTHGWDLARALGHPADREPELAAVLPSQARLAITDAYRGPDGQALFGPAVAAPEDVVQETLLRAWRSDDGCEGRSSAHLAVSDRDQCLPHRAGRSRMRS